MPHPHSTSEVNPPSAWVDFGQPSTLGAARLRHCFGSPQRVLVANRLDEVAQVLDAAHAAAVAGAWCLGYVRYEAAAAFDSALATHPANGPLAWFGVFQRAQDWGAPSTANDMAQGPHIRWENTWNPSAYATAVTKITQAIAQGEFYQVNLTGMLNGVWAEDSSFDEARVATLFAALQQAQPGGYAMRLNTGSEQVLSVSPELFFDWSAPHILARPMKGTAARGLNPSDDADQAQALRSSPKERAENVMIVDLLRNDLSRVAMPFSVQVPQLFQTEALPTVWQMTSDVIAQTKPGTRLSDIFAALFPCGSVTGAPKAQAMKAIRALESQARGIYCGALGVLQPGGRATFNVPIRTLTVRGTEVQCGIGSGITAGSVAQREWEECQQKQAFVRRASRPFSVLETLALQNGVWQNRAAHMARMAAAAKHFGFPWRAADVEAALDAAVAQSVTEDGTPEASGQAANWRATRSLRGRCLLHRNGSVQVTYSAQPPSPERALLALAEKPFLPATDPAERDFVQFKTTWREHYDAFAPSDPAVFDTVLWNSHGQLTECTRGNLAVQIDGEWLTPPLACGLLGGVGRQLALAEGRLREAIIPLDDLPRVQALAFLNSLRGWIQADWASQPR